MPITVALGGIAKGLPKGNPLGKQARDGGALDATQVMVQFICSTGAGGLEHDPDKSPDSHVRPEHAALHGTVWELDGASAPIPPLDYGCRCAIRYVAKPGTPAAEALPEAPSDPISSPAGNYRTWLDENAPGWRDVAQDMAKATAGDELAVGYKAAQKVGLPGDKRALVRMIAQADQKAAPVVPPAPTPAPAPEPPPPIPPPAPAPDRAAVPPRPEWLPAPKDATEGRGMVLTGSPPAEAVIAGLPPAAPVAPETIETAERLIASRRTERNVVVSASGTVIEAREGNAVSAPVSGEAMLRLRNGVLTHNHPDTGKNPARQWFNPPSDADLALAIMADAKAVRAVTPNGLVYQLERPATGWGAAAVGMPQFWNQIERDTAAMMRRARSHPVVLAGVARAVASGLVTPADAGLLMQHLALQQLAADGKILYTVGRYAG